MPPTINLAPPANFDVAPPHVQHEYEERAKRYRIIVEGRAKPKPESFESLGEQLGMTRQAVHKVWKKLTSDGAQLTGRPRTNAGRKKEASARLIQWMTKRAAAIAAGQDTTVIDGRIAEWEGRVRSL